MNIKMRRKIFTIIFSMTISGMLCSCSILPDDEQTLAPPVVKVQETDYKTRKVVRKDITQSIKDMGNFVPIITKNLSFNQSGVRIKTINIKTGQKVKKGDVLITLDSGNLSDLIKIQENLIKKVQLQLDDNNALLNKYMSLPKDYQPAQKELDDIKNKIKAKEMDLENAKLKMGSLNRKQSEAMLTAPLTGVITFMDPVNPGDFAEAGKTIITIADTNSFYLYFQTLRTDMSMVEKGMKVEITYRGKKYQGQVVATQNDSFETLDMTNSMLISINNLPADASFTDTAEFIITKESKKNVIVIPKKLVAPGKRVQILDGEIPKWVDVVTGIESPDEVEIVSGLKEGQDLIIPDYDYVRL